MVTFWQQGKTFQLRSETKINMAASSNSLKTNFQWVFAGNTVNSACQWAVVALLAKWGSTELLGAYVLILAVIMPITTLSKLQMRAIYVTDAENQFPFSDYFNTASLAAALGFLAAVIYSFTADYTKDFILSLILIGAARSLDNPSDMLMGYCQKMERMEFVGLGMMLRGLTTIAAVIGPIYLTGSLVKAAGALVAAALLRLFLYELPVVRRLAAQAGQPSFLKLGLSWPSLKRIALMGIPLGLVLFLATLANSLIRVVLESGHGKDQLAYYGAAAYPLVVGTMVMSALGQSAAPRLARYFEEGSRQFWRLLGKMIGLATGLGLLLLIGVWLVGKPALSFLYEPEYGAYHTEFIIMAAGSVFLFVASVMGFGLTAARKFTYQLGGALFTCTAAALLSWWLIPEGGIRAAAWVYFWLAVIRVAVRIAILVLTKKQSAVASGPEAG